MLKNDPLRFVILSISCLCLGIINFPFFRTIIEGEDYGWSIGDLSGYGMTGDWWVILIIFIYTLSLQISGWRSIKKIFTYHFLKSEWNEFSEYPLK